MQNGKLFASALAIAMAFTQFSGDASAASAGKKVFKKCKACHSANKGGANKIGPNLFGVVGRAAASAPGYTKYSKAMKASGVTWTEENLDKFLKRPKKFIKKTKMGFSGLKKDEDRAAVIEFLKSMK